MTTAKYVSITDSAQIAHLNGEGGLIGASTAFFIPEIPVPLYIAGDYATIGSLKNIPTQNNSGFTAYVGVGTPGTEVHTEQSYTGTLIEINIFKQWDWIYNYISTKKTN